MAKAATFDTHAAIVSLRRAGFEEAQAEAAVDMVRDAINEGGATKADIAALKTDIADLKAEMAALEMRLTVRMYTAVGIGVAVLAAIQKLL